MSRNILKPFEKLVVLNSQGQAMIEFVIIVVFLMITILGLEFSFKEILAPAFKRMTAVIRWPIP
jgi:hypothetical protein